VALSSGSRLGSYEIAERIGAGGMGEVYRATDTSLGRQAALKILPDAVAADDERLARFDREAEILATLSHPNIAVIYGVERSTSTPALVMELVDGPTLADRLSQGPIPVNAQSPNADIFTLSMRDLTVEPFANSRFSEIAAKFSPDGRWIAFVSDETGQQEVYVAPAGRAAAKAIVSTDGGFAPRWRHDGRQLVYIRDDGTFMAVPMLVNAGPLTPGQPRPMFQSTIQTRPQTPFDVTSDGRLLVMADADDAMPRAITLIINWPASLRTQ
jgi:hypothetical protein